MNKGSNSNIMMFKKNKKELFSLLLDILLECSEFEKNTKDNNIRLKELNSILKNRLIRLMCFIEDLDELNKNRLIENFLIQIITLLDLIYKEVDNVQLYTNYKLNFIKKAKKLESFKQKYYGE